MGLLLSLFTGGGGLFTLIGKVFDFLKSPLGIVVVIAAVGFGGHLEGKWGAQKVCRAEKQESISNARELDLVASSNADEGLRQALNEANERLLTAQEQLRAQADETARLPEEMRRARLPTNAEWERLRPPNSVRRPGAKSSRH